MGDTIWALTSYFNPAGYLSKRTNFSVFRKNLAIPLLAVELGYHKEYELSHEDADILVQIKSSHVIWQKERLLNMALERLPRDCTVVAWIDCDVVFDRHDWHRETALALEKCSLVQPFSMAKFLPRDTLPDDRGAGRGAVSSASFCERFGNGTVDFSSVRDHGSDIMSIYSPGLAWAARRELISSLGFYDAHILGGGDHAMALAAVGRFEGIIFRHAMNTKQAEHYLRWARNFHKAVKGRVGAVKGSVSHLWHGDLENRSYGRRQWALTPFDFDPKKDIEVGRNGSWEWATPKEDLHLFVSNYFMGRREDG